MPKPALVTRTTLAAEAEPTVVAGSKTDATLVETAGPASGALHAAVYGPGAMAGPTSKMVLPVPPPIQEIWLSLSRASAMSTALSSVQTAFQLPAPSVVSARPTVARVSAAAVRMRRWFTKSPPVKRACEPLSAPASNCTAGIGVPLALTAVPLISTRPGPVSWMVAVTTILAVVV
ncbi:unannotated protein [freshwater metagenome]|uniref:Unannotated protein n=1 Tax=freshwater metagenome TaxID=449393 RepID=A0A6J6Y4B5_9ZZZZ